jgi:hypothetical protein
MELCLHFDIRLHGVVHKEAQTTLPSSVLRLRMHVDCHLPMHLNVVIGTHAAVWRFV